MGVIVTKQTSTGGTSVSGAGAYTQLEKLAMEMEMEFKAAKLYNYKEYSYGGSGAFPQLVLFEIWENETKMTRLFRKDFQYGDGLFPQLTRTDLLRDSDNETLTRLYSYNTLGQLISIETSGSGPY